MGALRTRWAAVGAAVAITLGAGGIGLSQAAETDGGPVFVAITPCRLVDTRPGDVNIGGRTNPLGADDTLTLQVTGATGECTGIPADATAAAMNVTAIQGSTRSYLSVYPADAALPNASNLNWDGGDPPTPNKVDVKLSSTGAVNFTNDAGTVHVAADLVGYYIDHTHDDRYYTKAEADTAFLQPGEAAAPPTTQTRWTGCNGPSMNTPDDDDNTYSLTVNSWGYIGTATNGTEFYCPLDLPEGSSINGFRALLRDTGPSGFGEGLARCFLQHMALSGGNAGQELTIEGTGVGTGQLGSNLVETPFLVEDPMPTVVVDNENFVYFIKCDLFQGGSTNLGQLGIYAAQVRYNASAVPGTNN